ncbi:MAG: trigger factor [Motilibacteraceae bacterium]
MKSAVETLNPTRVRLSVEVPFDELKDSLDAAYKRISTQVQIPGFRRGKVPPRLIDQRIGRAAVLEEAINEALPRFYGDAVREHEVQVIGQPEVEVTELADNDKLAFTAEVDVRPDFELPEYRGLEVTVDDVEVSDEDVEEQLHQLQLRFGVLKGVERAAEEGDFLSVDLAAAIGEEEVDSVTGLSYEVGSKNLLDGLDEAVRGMSADETKTFQTELAGGEHAGEIADVTVTVKSVKERELPELDDEFAQMASEFDTIEELRADARVRTERMKRVEQGVQARDKALEALLALVEVPLPESVVQAEVQGRLHNLGHQLEAAGLTKEQFLESEGTDEAAFDADIEKSSREAIKSQFVLDAIAVKEEIQPTQEELTEHLVRSASRMGLAPDQFADQLMQSGQVPVLIAEVVRGKALALVLEAATVKDASGNVVDLDALREDIPGAPSIEEIAEGDLEDDADTIDEDIDAAEVADAEGDPVQQG